MSQNIYFCLVYDKIFEIVDRLKSILDQKSTLTSWSHLNVEIGHWDVIDVQLSGIGNKINIKSKSWPSLRLDITTCAIESLPCDDLAILYFACFYKANWAMVITVE